MKLRSERELLEKMMIETEEFQIFIEKDFKFSKKALNTRR